MNTTPNTLKAQSTAAIALIRPFLSRSQLAIMADGCRSEEKDFFMKLFIELGERIAAMPKTYEQDGLGMQAVVHLHYFMGGSDWYITEKDMAGGVRQAFGYAVLNGDEECAEMGYISIEELTRHGVSLNLHFKPCTLATIKARRAAVRNPKPWVAVINPGQDDEDILDDFETMQEALHFVIGEGGNCQVMKRRDSGVLTTEF